MISVVIPYWKHDMELSRCMESLKNQTFKDFEVVVGEYKNIGTARNIGARKAKGKYLVFVDADIVLNTHALEHYDNLFNTNPDAVIIGQYHWLPPLHPVQQVKGIVGNDPRSCDLFMSDELRDRYCLDFYSGNFGISSELFLNIGEFDEKMTGHGGEDCEFAIRLQKAGHKAIFSREVVGFHIYHDRDQEKNSEEANENVNYISSKHNLRGLGIKRGKAGELPLVYA